MIQKQKYVSSHRFGEIFSIGAKNEDGNITIFGLMITLVLSFLLILQIYWLTDHLQRIKERSKLFLCTKKLALIEKNLVDKMEMLNFVIKTSSLADVVKILFPPLVMVPSKEMKKSAQALQRFEHISFLKKSLQLQRQNCSINPQFAKSPYKTVGFQLARNQIGETILKKITWRDYIVGENITLILESKVEQKWEKKYQGNVFKLETRMDPAFWNSFSGYL
jgi:hypothetical protein